ncbi:M48 family metalloprotease [Methylobacterium sp. WSM2598]|uniref:M48 family metalloprotease n=1 Tax=Methylobacterium sp. WSM2598 TaxID=398261 RepID=UPI00036298BC|nr:M48 family metalloprotease [Methylobacterium sp. WSM2598]
MRVNGLYGHVRSNDLRSLVLFGGFVVAFHVMAVLALVIPLAMLDPEHAPMSGPMGYVARWVPILTAVGTVLFAVQMAWHTRAVRRRTEFRFVDNADEPRLCGIVEPLAIAAGLPAPYVGVIENSALNAFACGIRRKDAILVFTRGLIDELDDDELAAVAAHEIVHIVNGDIRLIAATNVCLDTLKLLQQRRDPRLAKRVSEAVSLPLLALTLPFLVVLVLVLCFLRRLAVDGSHLTRRLIASAREFIADAEAVRLTQHPAALVSALRRIEGRSALPGLAAGQDAMMIDGAHVGPMATHPPIAERIAAIVAVTGSMALIAPARRDTRPTGIRRSDNLGGSTQPRQRIGPWGSLQFSTATAVAPSSSPHGVNRLGLTPEMTLGAIAALAIFGWVHRADLGRPAALAAALDATAVHDVFAAAGKGMSCQWQGLGSLVNLTNKPTDCGEEAIGQMLAAHRGQGGVVGQMADTMASQAQQGIRSRGDGTFSNVASSAAKPAEVRSGRCFQSVGYKVGNRGLHSVAEQPAPDATINLPRWLAHGDKVARRVAEVDATQRDGALLDYFNIRKSHGEVIHRFFGSPGLTVARTRYESPVHQTAIANLRDRLTDPQFGSALTAVQRAEIELLAADPLDFVTCTARRERAARL